MYIRDAVIDINTRCIRVHDFTPAEILLGYNPATSRHQTTAPGRDRLLEAEGIDPAEVLGLDREAVKEHIIRRDDRGVLSGAKRVEEQAGMERNRAMKAGGRQRPEPGDLVLLRDIQLAKHHGRKLDPRWTTPRIVVSVSASGVSCNVRQLHDPPTITKRYHLDDLVVYVPRNPSTTLPATGRAVVYSRDAFGAPVAFVDGQRAFHLDVGRS